MKWLYKDIATAAFNDVKGEVLDEDTIVIDVRDLVDKAGNDSTYIRSKLDESLNFLRKGNKIVICCDYGMSRSNSIAIGVMVRWLNISFAQAVDIAKMLVDESDIKIEMLNSVYYALNGDQVKLTNQHRAVRNILITGASGFLGRHLSADLGSDFKIFSPDSKEIDLKENVIELDLYVKSNKIECIVHLANPKVFTNTKAIGETIVMLKNVLDVCKTNNLKLIYLSGWEIYSGYKGQTIFANEVFPANPKGTYGETKWLCEELIKQYSSNYDLKYQIIRSGPVYGKNGEKPKFIYNFIDKAYKSEKIISHKYLNGEPRLDLLYVDDLVSLLHKCISSDFTGELNVGSGDTHGTYEIAQLICQLIGSKSDLDQVVINDYCANILMDNTHAREIFSWEPRMKFKDGLKKVIETYKR